ncbi:Phosphate metabolism transcription protein [Asimina triloba]
MDGLDVKHGKDGGRIASNFQSRAWLGYKRKAPLSPSFLVLERRKEGERKENRLSETESWVITAILGAVGWNLHRQRNPQVEQIQSLSGHRLLTKRIPSPHGGRGALPSEGGSPSDLLFLAGGGSLPLFVPTSVSISCLCRRPPPSVSAMLTIKRVPTVVSNYQEDPVETVGCGRKCLGKCCLPVSKLPLYAFKRAHDSADNGPLAVSADNPISFLSTLLLGQWEDRMSRGLFRYDVTSCETKVIPGNFGFIAQLNEGRHLKKRPTEFRVDRVLQTFDGSKFNFTKVGQEEVLFMFQESDSGTTYYLEDAPISVASSPSVVAINVSPIEYGHVLLIPHVLDCLPQRIESESFLLALHMAAEAGNPSFRLGYNSLGAFATINHLHFQAYYLSVPFPVEKAPTKIIKTTFEGPVENGVIISLLLNYPVRGMVFEGGNTMEDLSDAVSKACIWLQDNNVPYNILISDCGKRVFLFPQCYAEKQALGEVSQELLDTQVNPAVWEISGHMVLKRKKDYEEASEDYAWRLLAEVSLSEERFQEVKAYVLEAAGFTEVPEVSQDSALDGEEAPFQGPAAATHLAQGCLVLQ